MTDKALKIARMNASLEVLMRQIQATPFNNQDSRAEIVCCAVQLEMLRSYTKHEHRHRSAHESWGILQEELAEALDELRANNGPKLRAELLQVAAVALRAIIDMGNDHA